MYIYRKKEKRQHVKFMMTKKNIMRHTNMKKGWWWRDVISLRQISVANIRLLLKLQIFIQSILTRISAHMRKKRETIKKDFKKIFFTFLTRILKPIDMIYDEGTLLRANISSERESVWMREAF